MNPGCLLQTQRAPPERECDRSVRQREPKRSGSHKRLSICGWHGACPPSNGHVVMWEGAGMPLRFLTTTNKKEKRPPHICWDTSDFVWRHGQVLRGRDAQLDPPGASARGRQGEAWRCAGRGDPALRVRCDSGSFQTGSVDLNTTDTGAG